MLDYGSAYTKYHFNPDTVAVWAAAEEEEVSECEGFSTFFDLYGMDV